MIETSLTTELHIERNNLSNNQPVLYLLSANTVQGV